MKYIITSKNYLEYDTALLDNNIKAVIELTPTNLNNGQPAIDYIKKALVHKKHVITGNKGPIVLQFKQLKKLANKNNVKLKYSATTGGALPTIDIIKSLTGSNITKVQGILNGTSNFVLEQMSNNVTFNNAIQNAIDLGIAETNYKYDIEGHDTAVKMVIIANQLINNFLIDNENKYLEYKDVEILGIENIKINNNNDEKIKLLGQILIENKKLILSVKPTYIAKNHPLYNVNGKNKGIVYTSDTLGDIIVLGGASGCTNAAATILKDLLNIYIYE